MHVPVPRPAFWIFVENSCMYSTDARVLGCGRVFGRPRTCKGTPSALSTIGTGAW